MTGRYSYSSYGKDTPNGKVNALLEKIEQCYKQNDLHLLIFLIDMCNQNFAASFSRIRLPKPTRDDNLASTIYEKLMTIKAKNHDFQIKLLDIQATLSKQLSNSRKLNQQQQYQETMDRIRQKSFGIREKLVLLNRRVSGNRKVVNCDHQRAKTVTNSLKEVTEMLSHQTLKMKAEFSALREMLPYLESD